MRWCLHCFADIEWLGDRWFAVENLHEEQQPTDKDICPENPALSLTAPHKPGRKGPVAREAAS